MDTELNNGVETVETVTTNNVDTGAETPQNNDEPIATPQQQSQDKDNPANHAFAEMRRKNKEYESKLNTYSQADNEIKELAARLGYEGVNGVNDFVKAVKQNDLATKYQETQDPTILAEMMKESILSDPRFSQSKPVPVEDGLEKEIEDFNTSFGEKLTSFDDVLNLKNSSKVLDYMDRNNLSLAEAYKLANPDEYAEKLSKAARQQAINQARGTSHVNANSTSGELDTVNVSASEISQWKNWFPNKTDEQCRKEIANTKKYLVD